MYVSLSVCVEVLLHMCCVHPPLPPPPLSVVHLVQCPLQHQEIRCEAHHQSGQGTEWAGLWDWKLVVDHLSDMFTVLTSCGWFRYFHHQEVVTLCACKLPPRYLYCIQQGHWSFYTYCFKSKLYSETNTEPTLTSLMLYEY